MLDEPKSWADIAVWRRDRRKNLQDARRALTSTDYRIKSVALAAGLDRFVDGLGKCRVGIYWPIRREFNPLPYARRLIAAGSCVSLPVVVAKGQPLAFRDWVPGMQLARGVWDISYPVEGAAVWPEALIVPLLGFDEAGYRIGYGAGFYDRTLAAYPAKPLAIGVGFELGRLATIYPQPHDIPMNRIVTDGGVFTATKGGLVPL